MSIIQNVNDLIPVLDLPSSPAVNWGNTVFSKARDIYQYFSAQRKALDLPNPGTIENINKEVSKDVFLTNYLFSGLRADVSKSFSLNPAFQVSHSLSVGSPVLPSYAFAAFYATDDSFMQGNIESDMSLSGRAQWSWDKQNISKANFQLSQGHPLMLQLEHDYLGSDFSLNVKSLNPSWLTGSFTGVVVGSLLQSITPRLCLGVEGVYSAQSPMYPPNAALSYVGRYVTPNWIASAQFQATGSITASFWRKVADKVEAGIETTVGVDAKEAMMTGTPPSIDGITTVAAKYEFRQSLFRGQIDSHGKVACLVERRVLPIVSLTFGGEIDQFKNTARVGLGLQLEAGSEKIFEEQQRLMEEQMQTQGQML